MIKTMQCPGCGEVIRFDDTRPSNFCMTCGQRLYRDIKQDNNPGQGPVPNPVERSFANPANFRPASQGNLIISYVSEHPRVNMTVTFVNTRSRDFFTNNQNRAYNLYPGIHLIDFKIGKRTYRREVSIYPNSRPVMVQASWRRGVARISIMDLTPGMPMTGF